MKFFTSELGFSPWEVMALMRAHTLGKADIFNSGFHCTWVNNENGYFNTQYYINMANSSLGLKALQNSESGLCQGEITVWEWLVGFTGFNLKGRV
jgi:hypothetical protein